MTQYLKIIIINTESRNSTILTTSGNLTCCGFQTTI